MKALEGIYSHNSLQTGKRERAVDIARSAPLGVKSYAELAEAAAEISYKNRGYFPLFRGQDADYQTAGGKTPQSSLTSSFHRPLKGKRLTGTEKTTRREGLQAASRTLVGRITDKSFPYRKDFIKEDFRFTDELVWSILQHYGIVPTPLLDLTQSLRVACSFVSLHKGRGFVYMLGFEGLSPTIFYSHRDRYQLIRLSSIMPKIAKRPFYQEGYLLGDFPRERCFEADRTNFACRLMAKFSFESKDFWIGGMRALSRSVLYPEGDEMEKMAGAIMRELSST
jgi:hypothetical protein